MLLQNMKHRGITKIYDSQFSWVATSVWECKLVDFLVWLMNLYFVLLRLYWWICWKWREGMKSMKIMPNVLIKMYIK